MNFELEKLSDFSFDIDDESLAILELNTEIVLSIDDFEDTKTIEFTKCGYGTDENSLLKSLPHFKMYNPECHSTYDVDFLGFTFVNHNGFSYLDVVMNRNNISLASGDYLIILFEDGTKEKYIFKNPSRTKYIASNFIPLERNDLFNFLTKSIEKVKVVSLRKSLYSIYAVNENDNIPDQYLQYQYTSRVKGQLLLKFMTYKFIEFNLANKI